MWRERNEVSSSRGKGCHNTAEPLSETRAKLLYRILRIRKDRILPGDVKRLETAI